jgi:hypothetical protein
MTAWLTRRRTSPLPRGVIGLVRPVERAAARM